MTTLEVTSRRNFASPVADVWAAWTESHLISRWWGPAGFTCPVATMDVRPGGVSLLAMQAPPEFGGGRTYNIWCYGVVEPGTRLEYDMRFADPSGTPITPADAGIPPGVPDRVPHVVTFAATTGGGTALTITESGYSLIEARDMSHLGLEQCLDKLAALLAQ